MRDQVSEYSSCDWGRCGRDVATQLVHKASPMGCQKGQLPSPTAATLTPPEG